ncbi:hypothetical protein C487_02513 [Natrinema pallidum DSM 3751]|uniref:Uncharacterized protein n=1 Tax=Natrinema pallidum DSM 3751 TaxID=1227495 RepID=L9Z8G9_9EURY|nr:hypothetical protein C487_02513 [Natrinema pallidum DSM 3751]
MEFGPGPRFDDDVGDAAATDRRPDTCCDSEGEYDREDSDDQGYRGTATDEPGRYDRNERTSPFAELTAVK